MFCSHCGKEVPEGASFCTSCGTKLGRAGFGIGGQAVSDLGGMALTAAGAFRKNLTGYEHGEKVRIQWRDLFSTVFQRHSREEEDYLFICGTSQTTPDLKDVATAWPKPWLFSRIFLFLTISCALLYVIFFNFNPYVTAPAFFLLVSAVGAVSAMVFFFETNIPRNISAYMVLKIFILGGVLSLFFNMLIRLALGDSLNLIGALGTGFAEELAKVLAAMYFLNEVHKRYGRLFIVNGILIGSAVGAGFDVFESAGYAFKDFMDYLLASGSVDTFSGTIYYEPGVAAYASYQTLIIRAFTSASGHVIWGAIAAAALCIVSKGARIEPKHLISPQFLGIAIIPILLHAMWDWHTLIENLGYLSFVLLTVIAWFVGFVLLHRGIREINQAVEDSSSA